MYKIVLSALLLASVAFLVLPGVSQAQDDHNPEVFKKLKVLFEEILEDSTIDSETREYIGYMKDDISKVLDGEELRSEYIDIATEIVEAMLKVGGYGDETTRKLQEVHELLGASLTQDDDNSEDLKKLKVLFEEILEDSTIDTGTREYIGHMKDDVSNAMDGEELSSEDIDVMTQMVKAMLSIGKYGNETTRKLQEVHDLLGQLSN